MPQTFTGQGDTNVVLQSSHLLEKSEENEASRAEQTKHVCSAVEKSASGFAFCNCQRRPDQTMFYCDPPLVAIRKGSKGVL